MGRQPRQASSHPISDTAGHPQDSPHTAGPLGHAVKGTAEHPLPIGRYILKRGERGVEGAPSSYVQMSLFLPWGTGRKGWSEVGLTSSLHVGTGLPEAEGLFKDPKTLWLGEEEMLF